MKLTNASISRVESSYTWDTEIAQFGCRYFPKSGKRTFILRYREINRKQRSRACFATEPSRVRFTFARANSGSLYVRIDGKYNLYVSWKQRYGLFPTARDFKLGVPDSKWWMTDGDWAWSVPRKMELRSQPEGSAIPRFHPCITCNFRSIPDRWWRTPDPVQHSL